MSCPCQAYVSQRNGVRAILYLVFQSFLFHSCQIFGFGTPVDINITFNDADKRYAHWLIIYKYCLIICGIQKFTNLKLVSHKNSHINVLRVTVRNCTDCNFAICIHTFFFMSQCLGSFFELLVTRRPSIWHFLQFSSGETAYMVQTQLRGGSCDMVGCQSGTFLITGNR